MSTPIITKCSFCPYGHLGRAGNYHCHTDYCRLNNAQLENMMKKFFDSFGQKNTSNNN